MKFLRENIFLVNKCFFAILISAFHGEPKEFTDFTTSTSEVISSSILKFKI